MPLESCIDQTAAETLESRLAGVTVAPSLAQDVASGADSCYSTRWQTEHLKNQCIAEDDVGGKSPEDQAGRVR